jgi:hypothetical protein
MDALGRLFDIGLAWAPVDAQSAQTGKRVWLGGASGCTILVIKAAGTAGDDFSYALQQHTAASSGTSSDLNAISYYYIKQETTLDNDESWEVFTQTADDDITEAGAAGTSAEQQQLIAIEVDAAQLSDGYAWISLNSGGEGSNAQLAACVYILHGLRNGRKPTLLGNLLNPPAADA